MQTNRFFSYDPDGDYFETHATAESAKAKAESALSAEADFATDNGEWGERVGEICWGEIRQMATRHDIGDAAEYLLEDVK